MPKLPFDIDVVMSRVAAAVEAYAKAALFELAEDGYAKTFEVLVACILSIRTLDEVSLPAARALFARARTPEQVAALSVHEIDRLIHTVSFHDRKAVQIRAIAQAAVKDYGSRLPCDDTVLQSFPGVGPKCAHLVLGIACGQPFISVDVHVDRVTNRWGYVTASTPERTMVALAAVLPERYWIDINRYLVPFGKHVCTRVRPKCSTCPVLEYCRQVGVTEHR